MTKRQRYNGRATTPCCRGRRMRGRHLYAYRYERHQDIPVNDEDLIYEISAQGVLVLAAEKTQAKAGPARSTDLPGPELERKLQASFINSDYKLPDDIFG